MLLSDVQKEIKDRVKLAANPYPVAYPGEDFDKPSDGSPYTELQIVPNATTDAWCGTQKNGNILFNISYSFDFEIDEVTKDAEFYLSLFPERLVFGGIKIPDEGNIYNIVKDKKNNGRQILPAVIRFEAR